MRRSSDYSKRSTFYLSATTGYEEENEPYRAVYLSHAGCGILAMIVSLRNVLRGTTDFTKRSTTNAELAGVRPMWRTEIEDYAHPHWTIANNYTTV